MPTAAELKQSLRDARGALGRLYPDGADAAARCDALIDRFVRTYGDGDLRLFSAPGRTELGGNHTDHQHGRVLAAAVDLDMLAVARPSDAGRIRLTSPGYDEVVLPLGDLSPAAVPPGTTAALVCGMAGGFAEAGLPVSGFDACLDSRVYPGSGLSSSAAFETLVGAVLRGLGGGEMDNVGLAKLARRAENRWFGKPCGLMDQMACAVGGAVSIDFADPEQPVLTRLDVDFAAFGHALCITGPIGSHADLTDAYAAIPAEMGAVARALGRTVLREVPEEAFIAALPALRGRLPDRALLRAMHFYADDARVPRQVAALRRGDFAAFLALVDESGRSSWQLLQNVCQGDEQGLALALAESARVLGGAGAVRVHGGGFGGTIQAFVPTEQVAEYTAAMDRLFGDGACRALSLRSVGVAEWKGGWV